MKQVFILSLLFCFANCFAQTREIDHLLGFYSVSSKNIKQNNIKKEIIYSFDFDNKKPDSMISKTILYNSIGNIKNESSPEDTICTYVFYYDSLNRNTKKVSDCSGKQIPYAANEYDSHGNIIKSYEYFDDGKIMAIFNYTYKGQQLIKMVSESLGELVKSEQYYYNYIGKVDSIAIITKNEKYIKHCQYSNDNDTTTLYYSQGDKSEVDKCFYNADGQLMKKTIIEKMQGFKGETTKVFTYYSDGTMSTEDNDFKEFQGIKLLLERHKVFHHYYSKN